MFGVEVLQGEIVVGDEFCLRGRNQTEDFGDWYLCSYIISGIVAQKIVIGKVIQNVVWVDQNLLFWLLSIKLVGDGGGLLVADVLI